MSSEGSWNIGIFFQVKVPEESDRSDAVDAVASRRIGIRGCCPINGPWCVVSGVWCRVEATGRKTSLHSVVVDLVAAPLLQEEMEGCLVGVPATMLGVVWVPPAQARAPVQ